MIFFVYDVFFVLQYTYNHKNIVEIIYIKYASLEFSLFEAKYEKQTWGLGSTFMFTLRTKTVYNLFLKM